MNILRRLARRWVSGGPRKQKLHRPSYSNGVHREIRRLPFLLPTWNRGEEINPIVDYQTYAQEGYAENSVVYACIHKIATTAPSAPMRIHSLAEGQFEIVRDHVLNDVFRRPNEFQSGFAFQETLHTYLNLAGECYVILERDKDKNLNQMYLARPDRMFPIPKARRLLGFIYRNEQGEKTPFSTDEVLHIKYPNPLDEWEGLGRGLAPLSSAARVADVDNKSTSFIDQFFKNAAVPYGLLKTKNVLDDDEVARIRARIDEHFAGEEEWHKTMILDADAEYQQVGSTVGELAVPDLRSMTESRICAVFDVPPVMVGVQIGIEHATFSNFESARRILWTDKIIPDTQRISEAFTFALQSILEPGLVVAHDFTRVRVLQEERDAQFERADRAYGGGWITMNEARREVGFPARGS